MAGRVFIKYEYADWRKNNWYDLLEIYEASLGVVYKYSIASINVNKLVLLYKKYYVDLLRL